MRKCQGQAKVWWEQRLTWNRGIFVSHWCRAGVSNSFCLAGQVGPTSQSHILDPVYILAAGMGPHAAQSCSGHSRVLLYSFRTWQLFWTWVRAGAVRVVLKHLTCPAYWLCVALRSMDSMAEDGSADWIQHTGCIFNTSGMESEGWI